MWNIAAVFSNKIYVFHKKLFIEKSFFSVDYIKIIELQVAQTEHHMQSEKMK